MARTLKTSEAAALLNVSPNTLRAWERRFGYPVPMRSPGKHRLYSHREVISLREALNDGLAISSAISRSREALRADTGVLGSVLPQFDHRRADSAMEEVVALRSLEDAVEDVLIPSLEELASRYGTESAQWAFANQWAAEWLARAQRLAPKPWTGFSVLTGIASSSGHESSALYINALQLFLRRAGIRTLTLPVRHLGGLGQALAALEPDLVVIAGEGPVDDVARWAYAMRSVAGPVPVASYHRAGVGGLQLPDPPSSACLEICRVLEGTSVTSSETDSADSLGTVRKFRGGTQEHVDSGAA